MAQLIQPLRIGREVVGLRLLGAYAAAGVASLPMWAFEWHLTLHVLGAAMLIGNALVMAAWLSIAGFAGGDDAKRRASHAVIVGDAWFTVPGVLLLLTNGLAMVGQRYGGVGAITTTSWIAAGLLLLTLTGVVWAMKLVPAQLALHALSRADGPLDRPAYRAVLIRWSVWGTVATALPLIAVFVMTTKPTL